MTDSPAHRTHGTVTTTGQGSATAVPDSFSITVGIEVSRPAIRAAYSQAGAALAAVRTTLLEAGVARESISSTSLDVRVDTRWQDGVGTVVSGYTVGSTLAVTLRHDGGADAIVAAVVDAGDNNVRLHGMRPVVSDLAAPRDAARAAAWADARHAAEQYARLAGRGLGAVLGINEETLREPGPRPMIARAAMTVEAAPLPLEPGQSTISMQVQATWELL